MQKQITIKANKTGAAIDRWLMSKSGANHANLGRWAKLYQKIMTDPNATARQINFAKGIRGRILDRRMNDWMRRTYGRSHPNMRLDRTVPGSGSDLRPDAYFPDIDGRSTIYDIGGPSKLDDIMKYDGMADDLVPVVPESYF